jgi:hypothetical protein
MGSCPHRQTDRGLLAFWNISRIVLDNTVTVDHRDVQIRANECNKICDNLSIAHFEHKRLDGLFNGESRESDV